MNGRGRKNFACLARNVSRSCDRPIGCAGSFGAAGTAPSLSFSFYTSFLWAQPVVPAARELVVDVSALPGYQNSSAYISHAEGENEGFLLLDGAFLFFSSWIQGGNLEKEEKKNAPYSYASWLYIWTLRRRLTTRSWWFVFCLCVLCENRRLRVWLAEKGKFVCLYVCLELEVFLARIGRLPLVRVVIL